MFYRFKWQRPLCPLSCTLPPGVIVNSMASRPQLAQCSRPNWYVLPNWLSGWQCECLQLDGWLPHSSKIYVFRCVQFKTACGPFPFCREISFWVGVKIFITECYIVLLHTWSTLGSIFSTINPSSWVPLAAELFFSGSFCMIGSNCRLFCWVFWWAACSDTVQVR